jgi:hypothetical protein
MKKYNNSNKKPKKTGGKNTSSANRKSKNKTKVNTSKVYTLEDNTEQLSPSSYNGGAVISFENNDTTTVSEATTYITTVDASKQENQPEAVITALPNKEELYSKYTETEEETSTHANNLLPKANTDGVNTMIIIAGAFALLAFLVLILS